MDTNMYAAGYGQQTPQQPMASPSAANPVTTPMGGVGNMVQALMGGYNKYLGHQQQPQQPMAQPQAAGSPLQIHPQEASLGNNGVDANGNMLQTLFNPNQPNGLY